jgi:hypothetical protein
MSDSTKPGERVGASEASMRATDAPVVPLPVAASESKRSRRIVPMVSCDRCGATRPADVAPCFGCKILNHPGLRLGKDKSSGSGHPPSAWPGGISLPALLPVNGSHPGPFCAPESGRGVLLMV